jgi:NAD(P)-dependent dehydrogenase (short-subunit alcohol dehydrogenase family)
MSEKVVILTGASRGLGAALAEKILAPDTRLVCIARNPNDHLGSLAAKRNAWLDYYLADLADIASTEALAASICEGLLPDAESYTLINNAGMLGPIEKSEALTAMEVATTLSVNVVAAMCFMAQFLAVTKTFAGARRIVNISSGAARRPYAGWATYCATKAALDMATRCAKLDEEGSANPARFVSLAPGVIDTQMQGAVRTSTSEAFPHRQHFIDLKANDQLTSAEDAAANVLKYLARDDFGENEIADVRTA